jgi:hypothetical protein
MLSQLIVTVVYLCHNSLLLHWGGRHKHVNESMTGKLLGSYGECGRVHGQHDYCRIRLYTHTLREGLLEDVYRCTYVHGRVRERQRSMCWPRAVDVRC